MRRIQTEIDTLDRARRAYLAEMRVLVTRQLTEIDAADRPLAGASPDRNA